MTEFDWILNQSEGPFFERKSCFDRSEGKLRQRSARELARDLCETLAAMANADGGTVVLGVENDGTVSGADYPGDRLDVLRRAPQANVRPPLQVRVHSPVLHDKPVLVYEVDWSPEAHQLADGRYLLRVGEHNMPFPASDIEAMKEGKRRRVTEARFVQGAVLDDLDASLITSLAARVGLAPCPEDVLLRYRLAETRHGRLMLTLAALLLFGKDPGRWHPRCGIDFVKCEGTGRKFGADLNVVKRVRLDAPLVRLIEEAYHSIQPHVRERQKLVDLFFEERLEYPTFVWQEAIINAIAHRDYGYEGTQVEVWMFDERLEIRSPGDLIAPVTLDRLRRGERIHASRNPRIVRVLTDLGYMREQGEGIPRMVTTMEREGLYPPEFRLEAGVIFTVTLRNTPAYSVETIRWLQHFERLGLSGNQKRLLAYAREHGGRFTSRAYQRLVQIDLYAASRDIKDLARKGIVQLPKKHGRVYRLVARDSQSSPEKPPEYVVLEAVLATKGRLKNQDIREILGVNTAKAGRIARRLVAGGWLRAEGEKRGRYYVTAR